MRVLHKKMSVNLIDTDRYSFSDNGVNFTQSTSPAFVIFDGKNDRKNTEFSSKNLISQDVFSDETICYISALFNLADGLIVETRVGIDKIKDDFFMEIIPKQDLNEEFSEIIWPRAFEAADISGGDLDSYLVLPYQQGLILPNNWKGSVPKLHFDGQFYSAAAYMPWLGYVTYGKSWQVILETAWDTKYKFDHKPGGPTKNICIRWLPSLGKLAYARRIRLILNDNSDYNLLCKNYRSYMKDLGRFYSLKDKTKHLPSIHKLNGASIVHTSIKTNIVKESRFYNHDLPEANKRVVTFAQRQAEIDMYKNLGAGKLYVHLDGWAEPGYDNKHPDYLPACIEAGGWKGLKNLADYLQDNGDLLGLHDQYRDYYFDAPTFYIEKAVTLKDGSHPEHSIWAGGRQTLLCNSFAPTYVKRNFNEIFKSGIKPDCSYLDVFTCNEPDECFHPDHKISRRGSLDYRMQTFEYLREENILPSSEECTDWALKELVFCHYGPYEFMLREPGSDKFGYPVPLFNLVYHDSVILPWMMDRHENEDYMLYALLNAGMPYLVREGAYPNTDGSFSQEYKKEVKDQIKRVEIVSKLQEKLAFEEMVSHRFIDGNPKRQETVFSDGTKVRIDLDRSEFEIV